MVVSAKIMISEGWCKDCTGDFRECLKADCCAGCHVESRTIDYLHEHPEELAKLLITISMSRDAFAFTSPAGLYKSFDGAVEGTLKWLNEPYKGETNG